MIIVKKGRFCIIGRGIVVSGNSYVPTQKSTAAVELLVRLAAVFWYWL